jgi:hypothetical protein
MNALHRIAQARHVTHVNEFWHTYKNPHTNATYPTANEGGHVQCDRWTMGWLRLVGSLEL